MENFGYLLNQYVQRAGITDAELSRAIGVSRQTIFRWREGATVRPRYREDVVAIARKLRLTPEEENRLLLAAGFPPETTRTADQSDEIQTAVSEVETSPTTNRYRWWLLGMVVVLMLLGGGLGWWFYAGPATYDAALSKSTVEPATADETLILVTHFANYASSQVGYNVAGRLGQTLQEEIETAHLEGIRIAVWPEVVNTRHQALQVGHGVNATLVIFGEYDVGRVIVEFAHPADQSAFIDPALQQYVAGIPELSGTINSELPHQVRSLALIALGQIYLNQHEAKQALSLLTRARDHLETTPVDNETWGLVNFYLGLAYHDLQPPDLDNAINAYTESVEAWPVMLSSRINRSAAYTSRAQPDDWTKALADMDYVIEIQPSWALAYSNRASILINMGGEGNMALAANDLEKALELDPSLPGAYLHRAYLHYKQDRPMSELVPDLDKTLSLRPTDTSALNLYCWGYALEQQAELALSYCRQGLEVHPDDPFLADSRGVVYAMLNDTEAATADFEVYAAWLEQQSSEVWRESLQRRRAWIEALKAGENPITPAVLAEIRHEFGK